MINLIKETIFSAISGWHEGKGHKLTRTGDCSQALDHYKTSLKFSTDQARDAGMLECIARTYARLGNYDSAISKAKISLELFSEFKGKAAILDNAIERNQKFIKILQTKDKKAIEEFVTMQNITNRST